jgi:hypothetical protein
MPSEQQPRVRHAIVHKHRPARAITILQHFQYAFVVVATSCSCIVTILSSLVHAVNPARSLERGTR